MVRLEDRHKAEKQSFWNNVLCTSSSLHLGLKLLSREIILTCMAIVNAEELKLKM